MKKTNAEIWKKVAEVEDGVALKDGDPKNPVAEDALDVFEIPEQAVAEGALDVVEIPEQAVAEDANNVEKLTAILSIMEYLSRKKQSEDEAVSEEAKDNAPL